MELQLPRKMSKPLHLFDRDLLKFPCIWWPCLLLDPLPAAALRASVSSVTQLWKTMSDKGAGSQTISQRPCIITPAQRAARRRRWQRMSDLTIASNLRMVRELDLVTKTPVGKGLIMPSVEQWQLWHGSRRAQSMGNLGVHLRII